MPEPLIALIFGTAFLLFMALLFWPNGGLLGFYQRTRKFSNRVLREDALKHLHKSERHDGKTTVESLAGALEISTNRAAGLLSELQQQELIVVAGDDFYLTPDGLDYALRILRAHRLWERFLADETGFEEADWHSLAENIEHRLSVEQTNALSHKLGNPTHDPHGDPIPTSEGEMVLHGGQPLTRMPKDAPLLIVHIEDEPEVVYAQLVAEELHPGMEIRIIESSPSRIRFWADGDEHILAPIVAANISVKEIADEKPEENYIGATLDTLKKGECGRVLQFSPSLRKAEKRRLMDLGILPGTIIQSELESPTGDPTAYRIREALIALRSEQAQHIHISRL